MQQTKIVLGKWFECRSISCLSCVIIQVKVVFRKTVVGDWRFDCLSGNHLQTWLAVETSVRTNSLSKNYLTRTITQNKQIVLAHCKRIWIPLEPQNCFWALLYNCEDHFHLYSLTAVHSYDLYHIHITGLSFSWYFHSRRCNRVCEIFPCFSEFFFSVSTDIGRSWVSS